MKETNTVRGKKEHTLLMNNTKIFSEKIRFCLAI